jgi:hypothetical protein
VDKAPCGFGRQIQQGFFKNSVIATNQAGRIGSSELPGDKLSIAEFRLSIFQSQIANRKSEIGVNRL